VEDQDLVAGVGQEVAGLVDGRGGEAEHGGRDELALRARRLRGALARVALRHTDDGRGGVAEHRAGDAVDPGDVDDRVHQRDVDLADVGRHVARGHRGDQQLGHAHRQRLQGPGGHRRSAGAADRQQPVEAALVQEAPGDDRRPLRHGGHRGAAVAGVAQRPEVAPGRLGHLLGGDISQVGPVGERADVDHHGLAARVPDLVAEPAQLVGLGVQGSQQHDRRHGCLLRRRSSSPTRWVVATAPYDDRLVRAAARASVARRPPVGRGHPFGDEMITARDHGWPPTARRGLPAADDPAAAP
jgi:hypothetical protein